MKSTPSDRTPSGRVPSDHAPSDRVPPDRVTSDRVTSERVPAAASAPSQRPSPLQIEERLRSAFTDATVSVTDDSHLHVGHAGAVGGAGHYTVTITSAAFQGMAPVARHRLVYDALADWIPERVHALSIRASLPAESSA